MMFALEGWQMRAQGILLGIGLASVFCTPARAAWYEEAQFTCSDPLGAMRFIQDASWTERSLPLEFVSPAQGRIYADISLALIAENPSWGEDHHLFNEIALDSAKAERLRNFLDQVDADSQIPLLVQNLPSLAGYWVSNTASAVISGVFSYLFDEIGALRIRGAQLSPLVANGGVVRQYVSIRHEPEKSFLLSSFVYDVKVGNEDRQVWLGSCTYPAKVSFSRFVTTVGVNDKVIRKDGEVWYVENVIDGDRQPGHLEPIREDDAFLYFKGVDFSAFYEDYRISKFGGPFEVLDGDVWTNLYATTRPE